MKHSHLALISGFLLVVILAISWCGRKPKPEFTGIPIPAETPPARPVATLTPSPSASPAVAQATTPPPGQTPSAEFKKVASKVGPAVILVTIFDASGQLLRTGTGFFISGDGRFVTNWQIVEGGAHAVAKSADGKIRNVTGVLAGSPTLDLALLKAETKTGVPFLPLSTISEPENGTPVAVIGSPLSRREEPLATATISARRSDQGGDRFEISAPILRDAAGTPVVDANGDVVGVMTSDRGQDATAACVVRSSSALRLLLAQTKPGAMGRWVAAANESPSPLPSPSGPPPKATDNRKLKLTYNPAPKYPSEARYSRVRGSGRFRVTFGTGGEATEVQVIESTGKSVLDQAATASLRQWKSEPGHEWSLVVPITFEP